MLLSYNILVTQVNDGAIDAHDIPQRAEESYTDETISSGASEDDDAKCILILS